MKSKLLECCKRIRKRIVIGALVVSILAWDGTAYAINAIVSQDLPLLTQILATEIGSYAQLGSILTQASAMVAQVKEYTSLAKVAWGAANEIRVMGANALKQAAWAGVGTAFPEVSGMYRDIRDVRDLDYRNYQAFATLRGILWEQIYGPSVDYLHTGHDTLSALAGMDEYRVRATAKIGVDRKEASAWEEDCNKAAEASQYGPCMVASQRASIRQALLLSDIQETQVQALDVQERLLKRGERQDAETVQSYDRWMYDLANYMKSNDENNKSCKAGRCLYERFAWRTQQKVNEFRKDHPYKINFGVGR